MKLHFFVIDKACRFFSCLHMRAWYFSRSVQCVGWDLRRIKNFLSGMNIMNLLGFGVMLPKRNEPSSMASCTGSMLVFGFCSTDVNLTIFKCLMTTYSIFQPGCCMDGFWLVDSSEHISRRAPRGSKQHPELEDRICTLTLLTPPMETPDPPNDTPEALKQVATWHPMTSHGALG